MYIVENAHLRLEKQNVPFVWQKLKTGEMQNVQIWNGANGCRLEFAIYVARTRLSPDGVYAKNVIKFEYRLCQNVWKAAQKDLMNTGKEKTDLFLEKCQTKRAMISISQCRNLRMMMTELTRGCMLAEDEYCDFCIVINKVLNRMEEEENEHKV